MSVMNTELKAFMDYMEREKGLDRDLLLETIKTSLQSAARKSVSNVNNPIIEVDAETLEVKVLSEMTIVDGPADIKAGEISLSIATDYNPDAKVGGKILIEVTPDNFGRIAAQTAKQVIVQRIRDAEGHVVFNEYKDKIHQVISGTVRHSEKKHVILDLGRGEAVLPPREQIEGEEYHVGDRLKVYVLEVKRSGGNPEILVSRSHPGFVKKLFEIEVPEIIDHTIEIKGIAREPGLRTKIAVFTTDSKIDCVGACVGMRGSRVKNIVQELSGEKIDIVPWSDDIVTFARNALNPAKLKAVDLDESERKLTVYVDKSQFSLAIGKRGHNARLTSKLLGWKVDIVAVEKDSVDELFDHKDQTAAKAAAPKPEARQMDDISISHIEGLNKKVQEHLIGAGFETLEQLKKLSLDELYAIPGVGKTTAEEIMESIQSAIKTAQS